MKAITRGSGDLARSQLLRSVLSVFISGKVFPDGTQNLLDAVHRPERGHGLYAADLVEPGAHAAAAGGMLVGGVQERMVRLSPSASSPESPRSPESENLITNFADDEDPFLSAEVFQ